MISGSAGAIPVILTSEICPMTVRTLQWMARVGSGQQGQAAPVGGGRPSGGNVHVRAAEAAEDGDGFGAAVRGHVRERLLDRRAGVGAGWSGRGAARRPAGRRPVVRALSACSPPGLAGSPVFPVTLDASA
jgi:hypothetical protein